LKIKFKSNTFSQVMQHRPQKNT